MSAADERSPRRSRRRRGAGATRGWVRGVGAALFVMIAGAAPASAQQPDEWDPDRVELTRPELQGLLLRLEQAAGSDVYSAALRDQASRRAERARTRLAQGDFNDGDRIELIVEGQSPLADTFAVVSGRTIVVPQIGRIALGGLLRDELTEHLSTEIGALVRNPVVHARALIRILVQGEVGRPGYYDLAPDALLTDALMLAGGPAPGANLQGLRVERLEQVVWQGAALQEAVAAGRTLESLGLRPGDRIAVPAQSRFTRSEVLRYVVVGLPSLVVTFISLF